MRAGMDGKWSIGGSGLRLSVGRLHHHQHSTNCRAAAINSHVRTGVVVVGRSDTMLGEGTARQARFVAGAP